METKNLDEIFEKAVNEINGFFDNKLITKEDVQKAKIASSTMSMYQRFRATVNAETGLKYKICKDLAKDKGELEKYIKITAPNIGLPK